jgi:hypothetical protein
MKKEGYRRKNTFEKKNIGSRSGHGSTGFGRAVAPASLLTNPDRSSHRVDRISGRPNLGSTRRAGLGLITMSNNSIISRFNYS